MEVRVRLRQLIRASGISQKVIAARCGQSEAWLSKRLSDRRLAEIKADELPLLARALGVPISAFFEDAPGAAEGQDAVINAVFAQAGEEPALTAEEEAIVNDARAAIVHALIRHRHRPNEAAS